MLNKWIIHLLKKQVLKKDYWLKRMDATNVQIGFFAYKYRNSTTNSERKYCEDMLRMYEKRHKWYLKYGKQ